MKEKMGRDVPLAPYTTFNIGGPAQYFVEPLNPSDFRESIEWALNRDIPFFVLGGGANILISDSGYKGLIINTKRLNSIQVSGTRVLSDCGITIDTLVDVCLKHNLSGVEFAAGLPGTVGGALFMNAQAYSGSFSNIVERVYSFKVERGSVRDCELLNREIEFSYKKSIFQSKKFFIYRVDFQLTSGIGYDIRKKVKENRRDRREKGQYAFPNAGCIFKNDYGIGKPTGKIIEELGLKGKRIGDAEVYKKHANFIINRGKAKAQEVYDLMRFIEDKVYEKIGIRLLREINLLGNWE